MKLQPSCGIEAIRLYTRLSAEHVERRAKRGSAWKWGSIKGMNEDWITGVFQTYHFDVLIPPGDVKDRLYGKHPASLDVRREFPGPQWAVLILEYGNRKIRHAIVISGDSYRDNASPTWRKLWKISKMARITAILYPKPQGVRKPSCTLYLQNKSESVIV